MSDSFSFIRRESLNLPADDFTLRKRFIQWMAWTMIVVSSVGLLPLIIFALTDQRYLGVIVVGLVILLNLVWAYLAGRGYVEMAAIGLTLTILLSSLNIGTAELLVSTLALVSAATVGNRWLYLLANIIVIGNWGLGAIEVVLMNPGVFPQEVYAFTIPMFSLTVVSIVTRLFIVAARRTTEGARRTTDLLQASADVGQVISQILDREVLLTRVIDLISDRFDYYHVQVFLVSETENQAELVASTGEVGQRLLARGHRLALGSQSVIGQVTLRGEAIIARDTDRDEVHSRNELLPETRAELALPLRDGDRIIGALDIQSRRANAFSESDIQALQVIADLLATALRNARLFEEQRKVARENERLFQESANSLGEIQRLNQELTNTAWRGYLGDRSAPAGVTLEQNYLSENVQWTDALRQAAHGGQAVRHRDTSSQSIAVPVTLRGETIGAIEVAADEGVVAADTVEMVQAVAQRLAISLENARLYEESRAAALREQRINDISLQYQGVNSVEELLQLTVTELSESLGAHWGSIRLSRQPVANGAHESAANDPTTPADDGKPGDTP
ncbi:MAG: GAF domain-containing protein [Chloroflexi bacterium]|nr:GAF domain-containing protein [Chloroflexota bacterium]